MPTPPVDQQPPPHIEQIAPDHAIRMSNGQIYLDGKPVTVDELAAFLASKTNTGQEPSRTQDKK
jgi:hypothetical protein